MTRGLAALIVVVLCGTAAAQPDDPRRREGGYIGRDIPVLEIDDCRPAASANPQVEAGEHFERGKLLYEQGDYKGAVVELVSAYCLSPHYLPLMSIGQAYERMLEYEKAIAYFERFVLAVPKDAKPLNACDPDPLDEKKLIAARIHVLENLPAKIRVNTEPANAHIIIANDARVAADERSGKEIEVLGGRYRMTIEKEGFQTVTREIVAEVGKPYTFFEKLDPKRGRLRVHVNPAEARLFLDKLQVGTGVYEAALAGGRYTVSAEAPDFLTDTRDVEVIADRDTNINLDLAPVPQVGRRQLLAYSAVAGGVAGGTLLGAQSNNSYIVIGTVSGLAAGTLAVYFGTDERVPLGTSSLTITSSFFGGIAGVTAASIFTDDGHLISPALGGGLVLGAGLGYYAGQKFQARPGDAALVNSGALWGTVSGGLFAISFDTNASHRSTDSGIILSGLGLGTIAGTLLAHNYTVSRGRAALIDASGVLGIVLGLAVNSVASRASTNSSTGGSDERTSNFALGGLAVGLIAGGVLTRNMDEPTITVSPVMGKTSNGTATVGLGATW